MSTLTIIRTRTWVPKLYCDSRHCSRCRATNVCFTCRKPCQNRKCKRCARVRYCSKECQLAHWEKHKPNCIESSSTVNELFDGCCKNLFPEGHAFIDYGFAAMREHYDHLRITDGFDDTAEQMKGENLLMAVYIGIKRDVDIHHQHEKWISKNTETELNETDIDDLAHTAMSARMPHRDIYFPRDTFLSCLPNCRIPISKKTFLKAFETNTLDDFIHKYIRDIEFCSGASTAPYIFRYWRDNKLVIGPTKTDSLSAQQIEAKRKEIYRKYYT